jgi:hypothetical protein
LVGVSVLGLFATESRRRSAERFPDYSLVHPAIEAAEAKTKKLESIYHLSQRRSWDGEKVLAELVDKHGGIHIDEDKRESIARIFSVILWGELAAWTVSADLAERLDDVEAKMAATSQTFDEARHFYVMRDYLRLLGCEVPPLDAYARRVLREVLGAEDLAFKLVGMQLLVENVALSLFKMVAKARVEPVLSDLMPYFERDEARHVGLGINYLPILLAKMSRLDIVRLNLYQARIYSFLFWDTLMLKDDFEKLGLDSNEATRMGLRVQLDIATQMGKFASRDERKVGRGVYVEPELLRRTHSFSVDAFMPKPNAEIPPWQRRVLDLTSSLAKLGARAIDAVDS